MQHVYLGWHGHEITITNEGYKALTSFLAVFEFCFPDNPVGQGVQFGKQTGGQTTL